MTLTLSQVHKRLLNHSHTDMSHAQLGIHSLKYACIFTLVKHV